MLSNCGAGKDSWESPGQWRSNQSILKEINPEYSLEELILKLELQYFGHLMQSQLIGKHPKAGKYWGQEEKGAIEDEMVGWYHWLNGHEFEQTLGASEGQGSLVCCSSWGCKESDMTKQLNNNKVLQLCFSLSYLRDLIDYLVLKIYQFSSVQSLSHVWLFVTPWTTAHQASLSITNSWSPLKPMSIESMMPSNHLILCRSLLLLPWIFPSIRVFSKEPALCIRWPKYWSFSFNISPSNEHPGLISFRMDWLDLLAVQGTLKS